MRVVINAQLDPSRSGGIAQVVLGLGHGLDRLHDGNQYVFVCSPAFAEWMGKGFGANIEIVVNRRSTPGPKRGIRESDGFWESFGPDVLHFPYQSFTRTSIPSVFNPHDLQHLHLPECFEEDERDRREALYREACDAATIVAVASDWVREDLIARYQLSPEKIVNVPWGPPTQTYERPTADETRQVLAKHDLQPGFMLYPAQTWPHKNHLALLDAMHMLRMHCDEGACTTKLRLVCTGAMTDHYAPIERRVNELGLQSGVRFLGWVPGRDLVALYQSALFVVLPTLFEAESLPLLEAFAEGVPVACSRVTSLPEQAGDAAIFFDPTEPSSIAEAIARLAGDRSLRDQCVTRGRQRLTEFSWDATARAYRNVYTTIASAKRELAASQSLVYRFT